jgi:hypothetical protein
VGPMPISGHGMDGRLATLRGEAAWFTFFVLG